MIESPSTATPTRHQLAAALRAGAAVGNGADVASASDSYLRLPTEGLYDGADLERGASLLRQLGLLEQVGDQLFPDARLLALLTFDEEKACELLLALFMEQANPLWLQVAAGGGGVVADELVPDDAQQVIRSVIPDPETREALLLSLANKFDSADQEERAERGRKGEEFVVAACSAELASRGHSDLASRVRHVSLISDQLGYDVVSPNVVGADMRLEVKTTRQVASPEVTVILSRNEARAGSRDSHWRLVVCRITAADEVALVGSCPYSQLSSVLPNDTEAGEWMSCRLRLQVEALDPGLAFLSE